MSRIAYVNGQYVRHHDAGIHIEDRCVQFADGVYEVCPVRSGRIMDLTRHFDRLNYSLGELSIQMPMSRAALGHVLGEVVRRNRVRNGFVYFQVSRGISPRNHAFPDTSIPPSLIVTARPVKPQGEIVSIKVITQPDIRWQRVDIKSLSLLPNVLARQAAVEKGAQEAWFVDADGYITEGAASNVWLVDAQNRLVTRQADQAILRGVTRMLVMEVAAQRGLQFVEKAFNVEEAKIAKEAFVTSASSDVMPVVQIDDVLIGSGEPGPVALSLRKALKTNAEKNYEDK